MSLAPAPILSDRQHAVLDYLRGGTPHSLTPLIDTTGAQNGTIVSMARLGLVKVAPCGGLDPLIRITDHGTALYRKLIEDADGGLDHPNGKEALNMAPNTTTTPPTTDPAVPVAPAVEDVTGKPNGPAAPEKPKADLAPLYKELLSEVKKKAGRGHVVEDKAVYCRVSQHGKAVAYINHPTSKSVRVEIPEPEGSGYDVLKITANDEIPAVIEKVAARVALLANRKKAKEAVPVAA